MAETKNKMKPMLLASVIIATRNKATYLELTLAALERQQVPPTYWEVIVLNDASSDHTADVLDRYAQRDVLRLTSLKSDSNRGRSGARNEALRRASGEVVVFLDDDRIVPPDFLFWHILHQLERPQVVIGEVHTYIDTHIGPNIDSKIWEFARAVRRGGVSEPDPDDDDTATGYRILGPTDLASADRVQPFVTGSSGWAYAISKMDQAGVPYPPLWIFFTTGNASVPRKDVEEIGGFDEGYTGWGLEDNDLCIRLHQRGLPGRYEERAVTLHQKHVASPNQHEDYVRNSERFMQKYPEVNTAENRSLIRQFNVDRWIEYQSERITGIQKRRNAGRSDRFNRRILWCANSLASARRSAALADAILQAQPDTEFIWISSGCAADLLRQREWRVFDMGPDAPSSRRIRYDFFARAIKEQLPDFLISDEEMLILPIAHYSQIPSFYITTLLCRHEVEPDVSFASYARRIVVVDAPSTVRLPQSCFAKVDMCGPWAAYEPIDADARSRWRALFDGLDRALIIVKLSDNEEPDEQFVHAATSAISAVDPEARIVLIAGAAAKKLRDKGLLPASVQITETLPNAFSAMRCADAVIIPEDAAAIWELAAMNIPILVLARSKPNTPIYQFVKRAQQMCVSIEVSHIDSDLAEMANTLNDLLSRDLSLCPPKIDFERGCRQAAESLLRHLF